MIKKVTVRVSPAIAGNAAYLKNYISQTCAVNNASIRAIDTLRKSIDARQRKVVIDLSLAIYIDEDPPREDINYTHYSNVEGCPEVVVVGAGPAGLFAALRLIEHGLRPIVLERGKDVHARRKDIARISREQIVDAESNYSFGEGGAGAYSDGKLYTRSTKRGDVQKILHLLCQHGADRSILSDAHPHIGTDRLPAVIEAIRGTILRCGGEMRFQTRVDELLFSTKGEVVGVRCADETEVLGPVILATGHSARDVYRMLHRDHVALEQKGLAIGVRVEHPSELIDHIFYHTDGPRHQSLPAAEYRLKAQISERGVYSFCMCPGGFVIPAATGPMQIAVNGMSPSGRNGRWSNSGIVTQVEPEDILQDAFVNAVKEAMKDDTFAAAHEDPLCKDDPLRMMYVQEALEYQTWLQGEQKQTAPAQRLTDFLDCRQSAQIPEVSYSPGVVSSPIHSWMPDFISHRISAAFHLFGRYHAGFVTHEAVIMGIETRTSSPVRIPRDKESLMHTAVPGLFPCGEGAGYAGGIVSAAMDGERCADGVAGLLGTSRV